MIQRVLMILAACFWAATTTAQEDLGRVPGIEATISAQMDAFKADDFVTAFTFASPSIQSMFGSAERFGQMVRQGYPMVWRPSEVRYLELREIAGALWQRVEVRDQQGALHYLDYRMIEGDGGWKISGVQILKAPEVTA